MDKIAICAIFKDEARYLLEWIAFHKLIGVDFFVLYDNNSTDGGSDLIRKSVFARNVTLIDWPERPGQLSAYQHFCDNLASRFTWAAFIDIDEFIVPVSGGSIRDLLMRKTYANHSAILLQWLVFGPSGHQKRPDGLVMENYDRRLPYDRAVNHHVKSLVRTKHVQNVGSTPHIINVSGSTCNTRGEVVYSYAAQSAECHDVMSVYHYYTKSAEDWDLKRRRGKADALDPLATPYDNAVFEVMSYDATVHDISAKRFIPRLHALLQANGAGR